MPVPGRPSHADGMHTGHGQTHGRGATGTEGSGGPDREENRSAGQTATQTPPRLRKMEATARVPGARDVYMPRPVARVCQRIRPARSERPLEDSYSSSG